jgi:hypothetical protein
VLDVVSGFTAVCAVVTWVAVLFRLRWTEGAARPFTTIGFIGVGLALGAMDTETGRLVMLSLGCSLVSDTFLVTRTRRSLLGGVSAAVVARLAYLACFLDIGLEDTALLQRAAVALLGCLLLTPRIPIGMLRAGGRAIFVPVALHLFVSVLLVVAGALTGDEMLFAGTAALLVGDIYQARHRFVRPRRLSITFAMMAHQAGQALILLGVLR